MSRSPAKRGRHDPISWRDWQRPEQGGRRSSSRSRSHGPDRRSERKPSSVEALPGRARERGSRHEADRERWRAERDRPLPSYEEEEMHRRCVLPIWSMRGHWNLPISACNVNLTGCRVACSLPHNASPSESRSYQQQSLFAGCALSGFICERTAFTAGLRLRNPPGTQEHATGILASATSWTGACGNTQSAAWRSAAVCAQAPCRCPTCCRLPTRMRPASGSARRQSCPGQPCCGSILSTGRHLSAASCWSRQAAQSSASSYGGPCLQTTAPPRTHGITGMLMAPMEPAGGAG